MIQRPAGRTEQLFVLVHGFGASAADLVPVGERLAKAFPASTVVSLEAPLPAGNPGGFQWFPLAGVTDANRPGRVADALPDFRGEINAWQRFLDVARDATALVGFSQGAIMSLESSVGPAWVAGRTVAIAGRFAALPAQWPEAVTAHLLHGKEDPVIPYRHTIDAAHHLLALGVDVTADVIPFIGHTIDDVIIELLLRRLQTHVPRRIWDEAMRDQP